MKFAAAVLFATAASAADTLFKVSGFEAGCIPHSSQCRYSFGVLQASNGETTPVQCTQLITSDGTLPEVKDATCENSSRTFSVTKGADGLTLAVSQPVTPSTSQTGTHLIANADLTTSDQPNAEVQSYTGAKDFDLVSA